MTARASLRLACTRLVAVFVAASLAICAIAPALAIAELHDHDCTGEGCPACAVIGAARSVMAASCADAGPRATVEPVPLPALASAGLLPLALCAETPITNKVKLLI